MTEIKHRYTQKVLLSVDGSLRRVDLRRADLSVANLRGADLSGADLSGANLRGTFVIDLGQRSDGYSFYLQKREGLEPLVLAGCRYMPLSEARRHWLSKRGGTRLGDESQVMLDHGERLLKIREETYD